MKPGTSSIVDAELVRFRHTIQRIQKQESLVCISPERWAVEMRKSCLGPLIQGALTLQTRLGSNLKETRRQTASRLCLELIKPLLTRAYREQVRDYAMKDGLNHDQLIRQLDEEPKALFLWAYEELSGEPLPELESEPKTETNSPLSETHKGIDQTPAASQKALELSRKKSEEALEKERAKLEATIEWVQQRIEAREKENEARRKQIQELYVKLVEQKLQIGDQQAIPAIEQFSSIKDLRWEEVTFTVLSNESVRIKARNISKAYTFAELGFKDGRTPDKPTKVWCFFILLAPK